MSSLTPLYCGCMALGTWHPCLGPCNSGFPVTLISGSPHGNYIATKVLSGNTPAASSGVLWQSMAMSGSIRRTIYPKPVCPEREWGSIGQLSTVSSFQHLWRKEVAEDEVTPGTDSVSTPEIARRGTPGLYHILRNRNDSLHPNSKTNFCLSIYTTLALIPCVLPASICSEPLYLPIIPFRKHRKFSRTNFNIS